MMMGADGTKGDVLACTSRTVGNFLTGTKPELGFMTMDGQEVFKFAVRKVPESVLELLNRTGQKRKILNIMSSTRRTSGSSRRQPDA